MARRLAGPALTAAAVVLILVLRPVIPIPNPGLILLLTVAVAAVIGGIRAALVSAILTIAFAAGDSSLPGQPFRFASDQLNRFLVTAITAPAMAFVVGGLSRRVEEERATFEIERGAARERALTHAATDAIVTIDTASRIAAVNPATAAMFGYELEDLIGQPLTMLMPSELASQHLGAFEQYLTSGSRTIPWDGVELRARHASGRTIPIEVSFGEYGSGADRRFTGIIRDISSRKELEEQLLQAQKMDAIGRLAGGVAHDFNNMLTAIGGFAHLLRMDLPTGDPRREPVDGIVDAADRAATLTRQLLAFSRRQHLDPQVISLDAVVRRVLPMLERLLGEHITIEQRLGSGQAHVFADPAQMENVLINLAVNARDAMAGPGRLVVETGVAQLGEAYAREHAEVSDGPYVMLAVTDTGPGIDLAVLPHIFEPFFTTKPAGEGTGLGLATVYGTVRQSGGHVFAYSEAGRGTTFKVYLPLSGAPASSPRAVAPAAPERGTEAILVVEDEELVRDLVVATLRRQGYEVLSTSSPLEALAMVRDGHRIDLLLTDVVMPDLDGPALAEQARLARPALPVVFLSGYTATALGARGLPPGATLLEKPFSPATLSHQVRAVLDRPDLVTKGPSAEAEPPPD